MKDVVKVDAGSDAFLEEFGDVLVLGDVVLARLVAGADLRLARVKNKTNTEKFQFKEFEFTILELIDGQLIKTFFGTELAPNQTKNVVIKNEFDGLD